MGLARELEKLWKMKETMIPIIVGALGTVSKSFGKKTGGIRNQRKNRNYPDHHIVNIGQNT